MIVQYAHELYLASVRGHNEKGLDGVFAEEGMSLVPIAWLHHIITIQTFQSGFGDMNLTVGRHRNTQKKNKKNIFNKYMASQLKSIYSVWFILDTEPFSDGINVLKKNIEPEHAVL